MKIYTLSEQAFTRLRRKFIYRMVIFWLIVVGVGIAVSVAKSLADPSGWVATLIVSVVLGYIAYRSLRHQIQQLREVVSSIRLELGADYITRSQVNISPITINQSEIRSIEEMGGGLLIRSIGGRSLLVPIELADLDYQEIRGVLAGWSPIRQTTQQTKIQNLLYGVLLLIGFLLIFGSNQPWVVVPASCAMLSYYGYLVWKVHRSEGCDPKFRRNFRFVFGFLIFLIGLRISMLLGWYYAFLEMLIRAASH